MNSPVPVGTLVRYHGSLRHGLYRVTGYSDLAERRDLTAEQVREGWPDGNAYDLWPEGVPVKFGYRDQAVYFARRTSFTPVEEG